MILSRRGWNRRYLPTLIKQKYARQRGATGRSQINWDATLVVADGYHALKIGAQLG